MKQRLDMTKTIRITDSLSVQLYTAIQSTLIPRHVHKQCFIYTTVPRLKQPTTNTRFTMRYLSTGCKQPSNFTDKSIIIDQYGILDESKKVASIKKIQL